MREFVTGREMKAIDRRSIEEFGIPSMVLMERAALAVAGEAKRILEAGRAWTGDAGERQPGDGDPADRAAGDNSGEAMAAGAPGRQRHRPRVCAVCGLGNNGADGVAAARMLALAGYESMILLPEEGGRETEEFAAQLAIAKKLEIPVCTVGDFIPGEFDLVIDAVFGIGLSRPVEGVYGELVSFIMEQKEENGAAVVSVDIPSGIHSDTGQVMGTAVFADVTVTFGKKKLGQAFFPGRTACGRLILADAGFAPETEEMRAGHVLGLERADLARIPKRRADSHKGTWGRVLVAAGSKNMAGAAYLAALAAYRCGAGLVKLLTVEENRVILQERLPEALFASFRAEWAEEAPEEFREYLKEQTAWADVIVLGPGIGMAEYAKTMVETVLSDAYVPIILDADALNLAARWPYLKKYFTENIIVTPHIKEMARLTEKSVEEIKADPVGTASEFAAAYGLTCVLKDAATVIARKDGRVFVNESGSSSMAKGGSGDVLAGTIAGLMAIGMEEEDAAVYGVYVHGLAGELAARRYGEHAALAGELAACLGAVLRPERDGRGGA